MSGTVLASPARKMQIESTKSDLILVGNCCIRAHGRHARSRSCRESGAGVCRRRFCLHPPVSCSVLRAAPLVRHATYTPCVFYRQGAHPPTLLPVSEIQLYSSSCIYQTQRESNREALARSPRIQSPIGGGSSGHIEPWSHRDQFSTCIPHRD